MPSNSVAAAAVGNMPPRVVLYDGVCGFCDKYVQWLLDHDSAARLHFAPLQGRTAAELRRRHREIPDDLDTLVYVETMGEAERVYLRSEAILRICEAVGLDAWPVRWLRRLPRWCADLAYRIFVRFRYRIFGKLDACRMPGPSERERFLP